jgi:TonB family protein
MLERKLFASFETLQDGRYESPQFKTGASVSLITHIAFFIFAYSFGIRPYVIRNASMHTEDEGGGPPGQVVEIYNGPLIMPPPEVIRQLLGETPSPQPVRPNFIAEHSSIAQGEGNPNPRGSSQLPKGRGQGNELPSAGTSDQGKSGSATNQTGESVKNQEEPSRAKNERQVVESTDRPPTVTFKPVPPPSQSQAGSQLPDPGQGPDIAKLGSTTRESSATLDNQDSAITQRGPISVNAKGVGAIEEYRSYLERAIQQRWLIPPEANLLNKSVALTIEFTIAKDGRLVSVRLYNSTGNRALDRAAQRAIELAAPFRPLPGIFTSPTQVFTDTFVYYPPLSS